MLGTLKKIFAFAGKRKGLLIKSLVVSFLNGIFASLQFAALYFIIDALVSNDHSLTSVWLSLGMMVLSVAGRIFASYFSMNEQTVVGYGMVADKRISIGDRLRYIPMGYFNKNNIGTITGIVTTTLGDVEGAAPVALVNIIGGFFNSIVLILFLLIFNWQLGLIALFGVVCYLIVTEIATRKSTATATKRQNAQRGLVESVLEFIQGMSIVKSFGFEKKSSKSITSAIYNSNKNNLNLVYSLAPYLALQQFVIRLFSVILLAMTLFLYTQGVFTIVFGVLFVILSFTVFNSLESAGSQITMLQMLASSIETANSVDNTPIMDENGTSISPKSTDIEFENVDFSYSTRKILDNVSFSIPEKTTTAIVGPSGSGKTTMCNLIARFWDVNGGKITIGGIDVRDYTLDSLMKNISMVFQNVYLFADTIENNIKFGCPDATHEDVVEAAKKACCHDFIVALPDGYNTIIGEGGGTLSGGEKQRISIARAILKDAPIIILDEATSSVDPENEDELQRAIEALTHDKTIIMIAHRLKTVRNADQILVLNNTHIVQRGTHNELIQQNGLYSDFVKARKEAIGWKLAK